MTIGETQHMAEPAFSVIEKLGGKRQVAGVLGVDKSTLTRWCQMPPDGTGGTIPQKHWRTLMALGQVRGTPVTLKELSGIGA